MKTGKITNRGFRTALAGVGGALGLAIVLMGGMALFGTPGLSLAHYLPISPSADRHPPADRLLLDLRKSFQDYPDRAGRLFSAGQTILHKYELAYLRIESRGGVSIHRSYDANRISHLRMQELERAIAENATSTPGSVDAKTGVGRSKQSEPTLFGRYYYQSFPVQILKGPELIENVTITIAYEKIYIGGRRFANLFGVPHSISRLFYVRFDAAAPYIAGTAIAAGLVLILLSLREPVTRLRQRRRTGRPRRIVFSDETWPDPNRPLANESDPDGDAADFETDDDSEYGPDVAATIAPAGGDSDADVISAADVPDRRRTPASRSARLSPRGEAGFRILSDPANFVFEAPPDPVEERLLREKLAALEEEERLATRYEFEQERWNLPGFQSVMQPLRRKIRPDDLDFFRHTGAGRGFDNQSSLFDFRYYRYRDQPGYPEQSADIEAFAKAFLTAITDLAGHATTTLYLRNRRGHYHATLRRSGSVFISGAALGAEPVDPQLVRQLEDGRYIVLDDGHEIFFPVPCRQDHATRSADAGDAKDHGAVGQVPREQSSLGRGMLGLIRMKSDRPLYNAETLAAAWYEIRKFGESLFQARVFEEAISDPESTLHNGLSFHRDLLHEFSLKRELKNDRMLLMLRFRGRSNPESVQLFGLGLRSFFASPFRLYRIAADVFALLGPALPVEEAERRLGEFLSFVREQEAVDLNAGSALLNDDGAGPASAYEWFRQAAVALEDSEKTGLNRLRMYDTVQSGATAFRQMAILNAGAADETPG